MGLLDYHPCGPGNWPTSSGHRSVNPSRPGHRGVDKPLFKRPQFAAIGGRAIRGDEPGGAGYWVNIRHSNGHVEVKSFHLSRIDISWGDIVVPGQQIGISGGVPGEAGAGNTTGAHVHFELWVDGVDINPDPELELVENVGWPDSKPLPPPIIDPGAEPINYLELIMAGAVFQVDSGPLVQIVESTKAELRLVRSPDEQSLLNLTLAAAQHPFAKEGYVRLDWNNHQHRGACNAYYDLGYMKSLPTKLQHDDRPSGWQDDPDGDFPV